MTTYHDAWEPRSNNYKLNASTFYSHQQHIEPFAL